VKVLGVTLDIEQCLDFGLPSALLNPGPDETHLLLGRELIPLLLRWRAIRGGFGLGKWDDDFIVITIYASYCFSSF
jgi:hypothetical protein